MRFSVIVPIYKMEKYLTCCLDSILRQSFRDFEAILVDDGSPDSCPEICDLYATRDPRFRVLHKPNGGLVSARKAGLRLAQGEYIVHLDSDDYLADSFLEQADARIRETGADMVCFGIQNFSEDGNLENQEREPVPEGFYDRAAMEQQIYPRLLRSEDCENMFYYWWGKAIRRPLAWEPQMAIADHMKMGEDICGEVPCYLAARSVYISGEPLYFRNLRQGSMSRAFREDMVWDAAGNVDHFRNLPQPLPPDFDAQISRYGIFCVLVLLYDICQCTEGSRWERVAVLRRVVEASSLAREVQRASFRTVTPKCKITFYLLKRGDYRTAYAVMQLCEWLKKGNRQ